MNRNKDDLSIWQVHRPTPLSADGHRATKHSTRSGRPHQNEQSRPHVHPFDIQPEAARLDFRHLGRLVDPPLAALA